MNATQLQAELAQFFGGADSLQKHAPFGGKGILATDGVQYLAKEAKCYWLLDLIVSVQKKLLAEEFLSVKLKRREDGGVSIAIDDGNGKIIYQQECEYSDFPLDNFTLFITNYLLRGGEMTVMLPTEY